MHPLGGILLPPLFGVAATAWVLATQHEGLIFPSVGLAVLIAIGGYVWKYTRRADKVLVDRISELEIDRNFNRARGDYFQRWAFSGKEPTYPEPRIQDYRKGSDDGNGPE